MYVCECHSIVASYENIVLTINTSRHCKIILKYWSLSLIRLSLFKKIALCDNK